MSHPSNHNKTNEMEDVPIPNNPTPIEKYNAQKHNKRAHMLSMTEAASRKRNHAVDSHNTPPQPMIQSQLASPTSASPAQLPPSLLPLQTNQSNQSTALISQSTPPSQSYNNSSTTLYDDENSHILLQQRENDTQMSDDAMSPLHANQPVTNSLEISQSNQQPIAQQPVPTGEPSTSVEGLYIDHQLYQDQNYIDFRNMVDPNSEDDTKADQTINESDLLGQLQLSVNDDYNNDQQQQNNNNLQDDPSFNNTTNNNDQMLGKTRHNSLQFDLHGVVHSHNSAPKLLNSNIDELKAMVHPCGLAVINHAAQYIPHPHQGSTTCTECESSHYCIKLHVAGANTSIAGHFSQPMEYLPLRTFLDRYSVADYNSVAAQQAATALGLTNDLDLECPVLAPTKKGYLYLKSEWYWILIQLIPLLPKTQYAFKLTCTLIELLAKFYQLGFNIDLFADDARKVRDQYGYYSTLPPFSAFVQVLLRASISDQNVYQHIYNIRTLGPLKSTLAHMTINKQHAQANIGIRGNGPDQQRYISQTYGIQVSTKTALTIFRRHGVGQDRLDNTQARVNISSIHQAPQRECYVGHIKTNLDSACDASSTDETWDLLFILKELTRVAVDLATGLPFSTKLQRATWEKRSAALRYAIYSFVFDLCPLKGYQPCAELVMLSPDFSFPNTFGETLHSLNCYQRLEQQQPLNNETVINAPTHVGVSFQAGANSVTAQDLKQSANIHPTNQQLFTTPPQSPLLSTDSFYKDQFSMSLVAVVIRFMDNQYQLGHLSNVNIKKFCNIGLQHDELNVLLCKLTSQPPFYKTRPEPYNFDQQQNQQHKAAAAAYNQPLNPHQDWRCINALSQPSVDYRHLQILSGLLNKPLPLTIPIDRKYFLPGQDPKSKHYSASLAATKLMKLFYPAINKSDSPISPFYCQVNAIIDSFPLFYDNLVANVSTNPEECIYTVFNMFYNNIKSKQYTELKKSQSVLKTHQQSYDIETKVWHNGINNPEQVRSSNHQSISLQTNQHIIAYNFLLNATTAILSQHLAPNISIPFDSALLFRLYQQHLLHVELLDQISEFNTDISNHYLTVMNPFVEIVEFITGVFKCLVYPSIIAHLKDSRITSLKSTHINIKDALDLINIICESDLHQSDDDQNEDINNKNSDEPAQQNRPQEPPINYITANSEFQQRLLQNFKNQLPIRQQNLQDGSRDTQFLNFHKTLIDFQQNNHFPTCKSYSEPSLALVPPNQPKQFITTVEDCKSNYPRATIFRTAQISYRHDQQSSSQLFTLLVLTSSKIQGLVQQRYGLLEIIIQLLWSCLKLHFDQVNINNSDMTAASETIHEATYALVNRIQLVQTITWSDIMCNQPFFINSTHDHSLMLHVKDANNYIQLNEGSICKINAVTPHQHDIQLLFTNFDIFKSKSVVFSHPGNVDQLSPTLLELQQKFSQYQKNLSEYQTNVSTAKRFVQQVKDNTITMTPSSLDAAAGFATSTSTPQNNATQQSTEPIYHKFAISQRFFNIEYGLKMVHKPDRDAQASIDANSTMVDDDMDESQSNFIMLMPDDNLQNGSHQMFFIHAFKTLDQRVNDDNVTSEYIKAFFRQRACQLYRNPTALQPTSQVDCTLLYVSGLLNSYAALLNKTVQNLPLEPQTTTVAPPNDSLNHFETLKSRILLQPVDQQLYQQHQPYQQPLHPRLPLSYDLYCVGYNKTNSCFTSTALQGAIEFLHPNYGYDPQNVTYSEDLYALIKEAASSIEMKTALQREYCQYYYPEVFTVIGPILDALDAQFDLHLKVVSFSQPQQPQQPLDKLFAIVHGWQKNFAQERADAIEKKQATNNSTNQPNQEVVPEASVDVVHDAISQIVALRPSILTDLTIIAHHLIFMYAKISQSAANDNDQQLRSNQLTIITWIVQFFASSATTTQYQPLLSSKLSPFFDELQFQPHDCCDPDKAIVFGGYDTAHELFTVLLSRVFGFSDDISDPNGIVHRFQHDISVITPCSRFGETFYPAMIFLCVNQHWILCKPLNRPMLNVTNPSTQLKLIDDLKSTKLLDNINHQSHMTNSSPWTFELTQQGVMVRCATDRGKSIIAVYLPQTPQNYHTVAPPTPFAADAFPSFQQFYTRNANMRNQSSGNRNNNNDHNNHNNNVNNNLGNNSNNNNNSLNRSNNLINSTVTSLQPSSAINFLRDVCRISPQNTSSTTFPQSCTISDVLSWRHKLSSADFLMLFESCHTLIQPLFPTYTRSQSWPQAPVLKESDHNYLKECTNTIKHNLELVLYFFGFTIDPSTSHITILSISNFTNFYNNQHNFQRVSRILESLCIFQVDLSIVRNFFLVLMQLYFAGQSQKSKHLDAVSTLFSNTDKDTSSKIAGQFHLSVDKVRSFEHWSQFFPLLNIDPKQDFSTAAFIDVLLSKNQQSSPFVLNTIPSNPQQSLPVVDQSKLNKYALELKLQSASANQPAPMCDVQSLPNSTTSSSTITTTTSSLQLTSSPTTVVSNHLLTSTTMGDDEITLALIQASSTTSSLPPTPSTTSTNDDPFNLTMMNDINTTNDTSMSPCRQRVVEFRPFTRLHQTHLKANEGESLGKGFSYDPPHHLFTWKRSFRDLQLTNPRYMQQEHKHPPSDAYANQTFTGQRTTFEVQRDCASFDIISKYIMQLADFSSLSVDISMRNLYERVIGGMAGLTAKVNGTPVHAKKTAVGYDSHSQHDTDSMMKGIKSYVHACFLRALYHKVPKFFLTFDLASYHRASMPNEPPTTQSGIKKLLSTNAKAKLDQFNSNPTNSMDQVQKDQVINVDQLQSRIVDLIALGAPADLIKSLTIPVLRSSTLLNPTIKEFVQKQTTTTTNQQDRSQNQSIPANNDAMNDGDEDDDEEDDSDENEDLIPSSHSLHDDIIGYDTESWSTKDYLPGFATTCGAAAINKSVMVSALFLYHATPSQILQAIATQPYTPKRKSKKSIEQRLAEHSKKVAQSLLSTSTKFREFQCDLNTALPFSTIEKLRVEDIQPWYRQRMKSMKRRLLVHDVIVNEIRFLNEMLQSNGLPPVPLVIQIIWTPVKHSLFQPIEFLWSVVKRSTQPDQFYTPLNAPTLNWMIKTKEHLDSQSFSKLHNTFLGCFRDAEKAVLCDKWQKALNSGNVPQHFIQEVANQPRHFQQAQYAAVNNSNINNTHNNTRNSDNHKSNDDKNRRHDVLLTSPDQLVQSIFGDAVSYLQKDNVTYLSSMWTWKLTDITQPSLSPNEIPETSLFYPLQSKPTSTFREIIEISTLDLQPNAKMLRATNLDRSLAENKPNLEQQCQDAMTCKMLQLHLNHIDQGCGIDYSTIFPKGSETIADVVNATNPCDDVRL